MAYGDRVGVLVVACLAAAVGCGSSLGTSHAGDAAGGGTCSADVPPGQACNTLKNVGAAVTPACVNGTIPTGTGGSIADGKYKLTARIYYDVTSCPTDTISQPEPDRSETYQKL